MQNDTAADAGAQLSEGDELVTFGRIVKESGMPASRVRLALGEAGALLRVFPGEGYQGREDRRKKRYPLAYTLALLRGETRDEGAAHPEIEADEPVPFGRIVSELGWSPNTARRYLDEVRHLVRLFPDPKNSRKKLYPLRYTVKLLRRVHGRVQARGLRAHEGTADRAALAGLKVAAHRLQQLSREASTLAQEVRYAFEILRRRPLVVEISTLPDPDLTLAYPLTVLVTPLRRAVWRAVIPEIPLRAEDSTPEGAVSELRERIAASFRQLRTQPSIQTILGQALNDFVVPRSHRT